MKEILEYLGLTEKQFIEQRLEQYEISDKTTASSLFHNQLRLHSSNISVAKGLKINQPVDMELVRLIKKYRETLVS